MTQRASLTSRASPSVYHKYGETTRLDIQAERKKGIVKDRWRMKERTLLYPITGCALSCPLPSWLKTQSWTLLENQDWCITCIRTRQHGSLQKSWAVWINCRAKRADLWSQSLCWGPWKTDDSAGVCRHFNYSAFNFCLLIYACVSPGWSGVVPVHHQVLLQRSGRSTPSLWHHKVTISQSIIHMLAECL